MQPPGIKPTLGAYMQFPGIRSLPAVYIQLSGATFREYMQPSGPISAAYIQPLGIGLLPATYALPGIGSTSAAYTTPVMLNTSTGHGKKLSNLAKIYADNAKYSGRNDSFTFRLAIFPDICLKADVLPEAKIKAFSIMLKGLALDYYYSNISISAVTMNFN